MSEHISNTLQWCRNNKKLFSLSIVSFILFGFLIFPYGDLTDYISDQIYKNTNPKVTLNASDLSLSLFPIGVKFSGDEERALTVDSMGFPPTMPPLELESLAISPSISSLLQFKKGLKAQMKGLFGGDVDIQFRDGKRLNDSGDEAGLYEAIFDVNAEEIALGRVASFAALPVKLQGNAEFDIDGKVDPSFKAQPETEFEVNLENVKIPAGSVPTPLGPISLPTIEFSTVVLKGKLVDGEIFIEQGRLGKSTDAISGQITGDIKLNISHRPSPVTGQRVLTPQFGAYRLNVDIVLKPAAENALSLFTSFISQYRVALGTSSRYPVRLTGSRFGPPPNISPLSR